MSDQGAFIDEDARWHAVAQRDRTADGAFYYGVLTTGVYCRPGCSSRCPRREHVEFFATCEDAETAGYRPCKRCRPGAVSSLDRLAEVVVRSCRRLEQEHPPSLGELAAEAGLSPCHFQRCFKELVGITPKQYARAQQAHRFRKHLITDRSVTQAIYDAGFGSSSRAYDNARDHLAMPPSTFRKGGAGQTIRFGIAPCYLGWVVVAMTARGICAIEFGDDPHALPIQLREHFPRAHFEAAGAEFSAVVQQVIALIEAPHTGISLPLDIQGTAFQQQVWQALRDIPPGNTVSYADLARRLGRPKAVRAVAGACAANKLAVAVPCHRVVRSDGALSGYRWGASRKRALLQRESGTLPDLISRKKENDEI